MKLAQSVKSPNDISDMWPQAETEATHDLYFLLQILHE